MNSIWELFIYVLFKVAVIGTFALFYCCMPHCMPCHKQNEQSFDIISKRGSWFFTVYKQGMALSVKLLCRWSLKLSHFISPFKVQECNVYNADLIE